MNPFIDEKKDNWQRLEHLLDLMQISGLRGLSKMEVRELGELYRRAASDLAIARAEIRDPKLINYLNGLVIRAHGKIYRSNGDGVSIIRKFFAYELPQAVRETFNFTAISFIVFMLCAVAAFLLCYYDPHFSNALGLSEIETQVRTDQRWWLSLNEANQIGSTQILTNNIQVTFMAFALGAVFCLGTFYILIMNGLFIGGVLGLCYRIDPNFGAGLANFMFAHGVVELACIFIASGAGLSIGYAIMVPGDLTRPQALKKNGVRAAKIIIGCALFLVVAGIIEGFISPADIPVGIKYSVGVLSGLMMFSFLAFVGRSGNDDAGNVEFAK